MQSRKILGTRIVIDNKKKSIAKLIDKQILLVKYEYVIHFHEYKEASVGYFFS